MNWLKRSIFVVLCSAPFIFVSLLWLKYPTWIVHEWMFGKLLVGKIFAPSLGEFGDVYGALNTLFSGLAFSGVIISIVIQSAELRATRSEMKAQVSQFEQQTKAMQKQVFESTFFNMVSLHNSTSSKMREEDEFNRIINRVNAYAVNSITTANASITLLEHLKIVYSLFMQESYDKMGRYFISVYQMLKFINCSDFSLDEKKVYANILRAQMSNQELSLLFINCLCYNRTDNFKKLVEKYSFFEHIYYKEISKTLNYMSQNMFNVNGEEFVAYSNADINALYQPSAFGL